MQKWIYVSVVVAGVLALAIAGWIVEGARAAFRPGRRPTLKAA